MRPAAGHVFAIGLIVVLLGLRLGGCGAEGQAGQTVRLAWDANTESNLAGYRILTGYAPGKYKLTNTVCGTNTTATVSNIVPLLAHYFAATAFLETGEESEPSEEVVYLAPATVLQLTVVLEEAEAPAGPWTALTNRLTLLVPVGNRFYRARVDMTPQ